jgi:hypothetical protein
VSLNDPASIAPRILYHYTSEIGLAGILSTQSLRASTAASNPGDARYGNGQYLSDTEPGTKTPAELSAFFLRIPFQKRRFTHYVAIDVTGLDMLVGRPGVFVIPNEVDLDLSGRIVGSGEVPDSHR